MTDPQLYERMRTIERMTRILMEDLKRDRPSLARVVAMDVLTKHADATRDVVAALENDELTPILVIKIVDDDSEDAS